MGGYFPWVKQYLRPSTLNEALELYLDRAPAAAFIAGGTSVSMRLPKRVETLIDLQGVGLDRIKEHSESVHIGATVTLRQVEKALKHVWNGRIVDACGQVGSRLVRNAVTVGGELAAGLPWCDLPVVIAALNAEVHVLGRDGDTVIPGAQWAEKRPAELLQDTLITGVTVPCHHGDQGLGFYKVTRVHGEYGAAVAAAWVRVDKKRVMDARVVAGASSPHPTRLGFVEKEIIGKDLDELDLDKATEGIKDAFQPVGDPRFSKDYRREMTAVAAKRALQQAMDKWSK